MDVDPPFAAAGAGAPSAALDAERRRWADQSAQILSYVEELFHWRECHDGYNEAVGEYYRGKHEHERAVIRLNAEAVYANMAGGAAAWPAAPARAQAPSPMAASPMAASPMARSPLAAQNHACGAAAARGKRRMATASPMVPLKRAHF